MKYNILILAIVALMCGVVPSRAQDLPVQDISARGHSSEGREFWLCFMRNFRDPAPTETAKAPKMQLFITSSYDAKVTVEIEEIGFLKKIDLKANTIITVDCPANAQLRAIETPERLAVHVTADTAIAVYGLNSRFQTTDTYMGLPTTALGTSYRAMCYEKLAADLLSAISIIATEDRTEIEITPNATTTTNRPIRKPFKVVLDKGDVYTIGARFESIGICDLTGSLITSNKPIAVFSGHQCAYVPPRVEACNHLVEQLPPIGAWGMHYYLGKLKERSRYTYRVVASEPNTRVFEDAKLVAVLKAGEYHENFTVTKNVQLTADKPILVAQYAQGFKNGDSVGDPMMILVSPTQQFRKDYRFATPINGDWHHYINVVAPTESIRAIRLNGAVLDTSSIAVFGESRYSVAQVQVPFGSHEIHSDTPFGLYSYGFGYKKDAYDAYGNMAGQSFYELSKLKDTLPPLADGKKIRDDFQVVVRDDRPSDKGLKTVRVVAASGLEAQVPRLDEGTPQVGVKIRPSSAGTNGSIVLEATDVAGNSASYTIRYVFDARTEQFGYQINDGLNVTCASDDAWMAGVYLTGAQTFQATDFTSSGGVTVQSPFTQAQGFSGYGGLFIGRRMGQSLILTGRLGFANLAGEFLSGDTVSKTVLDTHSLLLTKYQEGTTMRVTSPLVNLTFAAEYYPLRYMYVVGGVQAQFMLGSGIELTRKVLQPGTYTFPDGSREQMQELDKMTTLSSMQFGLLGGIGFSYPISQQMSVYMESLYTTYLGSFVSDATWNVQTYGLNIGARYRW